MKFQNTWTADMIDMIIFMKEIGAKYSWMADVLRREYPNTHFTELSVRVQYNRLVKKKCQNQ